MASLIQNKSLDFIWINEVSVGLIKQIIDGGQRSRTISAWFKNCIKLPKGLFIEFNGDKLDVGEKNWSQILDHFPDFANRWKNTYNLEFKVFKNYTNVQCAEIFTL